MNETSLLHDIIYYISIAAMIFMALAIAVHSLTTYVLGKLEAKIFDMALAAELRTAILKHNLNRAQILELLNKKIKAGGEL